MSLFFKQKVQTQKLGEFPLPLKLVLMVSLLLPICLLGCAFVKTDRTPSEAEIGRRVGSVLELPTCEYVYRDVIYIADQASFLGIRHRDTQLLFAVDVRVQAGINLQRGFAATADTTGNLDITLPEPEILMVDAEESTIHQYFKKEFGGEINRLDYYDEIAESKKRLVSDALRRGILDQAGRNAESLILSVLSGLSPGGIRVSFSKEPGKAEGGLK